MKLLRTALFAALTLIAGLSLTSPVASASEKVFFKEYWAKGSNIGSPWKNDSTFRSFRFNGPTVTGTTLLDTFYVDISDAAFQQPWYPGGQPRTTNWATLIADSAQWALNRNSIQARDSVYAFSFAIVVNAANADLDSVRIYTQAINMDALPRMYTTALPSLRSFGATAYTSMSVRPVVSFTSNPYDVTVISTSVDPSARVGFRTLSIPVNANISRTVWPRGIRVLRIIVENRGTNEAGDGARYGLRVSYPAVVDYPKTNSLGQ